MRSGGEDRLLWENVWQGGRGFLLLVISCAMYAGLLFMTEGKARFLLPFLLFFPALEDRRTGYISDGWSALLLLCGLLTSYEAGMINFAILSAALAGGVFFVLRLASGGGAGEGDIFLAAAIASWLSPVGTLGFLWAASASCALFSLPLLISGRRSLDDGIRFAPFLAAGGIAAFFFEETGLTLLAASWLCSR